jgi:hypothetical protein
MEQCLASSNKELAELEETLEQAETELAKITDGLKGIP